MAYQEKYAGELLAFFRAAEPGSPPSLSKFAAHIRAPLSEVLEWGRRYPSFGEAMEAAKVMLRDKLIDWGLQKVCDPAFVRFLLSEPDLLWPAAEEEKVLEVKISVQS